jgi:DNA-binding response OmpR family regulator
MNTPSEGQMPFAKSEPDLEKLNILIVDDVPASLDLLACIIREQGYEPRPVPSGKLALAAAKADPPDLILLDINMPEMNGFEVYKHLKDDETLKEIPVIFISALTENADKVKAFSMGAVDYITKPFQVEEITSRVQTHLRIRSMQCRLSDQNAALEQLVAERTIKLEQAYKQLLELDLIKDDFLRMISHEIRTPTNGVLGIGGLILDLCPPSETRTLYAEHFETSSLRLSNLIEDATMICDIEKRAMKRGVAISFALLLDKVREALPDVRISMDKQPSLKEDLLLGNYDLLAKALKTIILLAITFSKDSHSVHVTGEVKSGFLRVCLKLDALSLSEKETSDFFRIESLVRSESTAESLGLSPVVAHKIISVFGGELRLVKMEGNTGYLEAMFLRQDLPTT